MKRFFCLFTALTAVLSLSSCCRSERTCSTFESIIAGGGLPCGRGFVDGSPFSNYQTYMEQFDDPFLWWCLLLAHGYLLLPDWYKRMEVGSSKLAQLLWNEFHSCILFVWSGELPQYIRLSVFWATTVARSVLSFGWHLFSISYRTVDCQVDVWPQNIP